MKNPYHQPLLTRHALPRAVVSKLTGECTLLLVLADGLANPPNLTIRRVGSNVVLSWPAAEGDFHLQSSASLGGANWEEVAASHTWDGQTVSVIVPVTGPKQFFRLGAAKDPFEDKDPFEKTKDYEGA